MLKQAPLLALTFDLQGFWIYLNVPYICACACNVPHVWFQSLAADAL